MAFYRTNCAEYKSAIALATLFYCDNDLAEYATDVIATDVRTLSKDEYKIWKDRWAIAYTDLSDLINKIKTSKEDDWPPSNDYATYVVNHADRQATLSNLKKIANAMMNARLHARDVRFHIAQEMNK